MVQDRSRLFFRLLLNKFSPARSEVIAQILPDDLSKEFQSEPIAGSEPKGLIPQPETWIFTMHPSWYHETIEKENPVVASLLQKALPKEFFKKAPAEEVETLINEASQESPSPVAEPSPAAELPQPVKHFLLGYLYNLWMKQEEKLPVPREFLPETQLDFLLNDSQSTILDVVDLLPIHLIVDEIRRIVDRKVLQSVLAKLTFNQQRYLKEALRRKSHITTSPISILRLMKEGKNIKNALHRQGLQFLGAALSGADLHFIWHFCHILDTRRANYIKKYIQKEEIAGTTSAMQTLILQVHQFLQTSEAKS